MYSGTDVLAFDQRVEQLQSKHRRQPQVDNSMGRTVLQQQFRPRLPTNSEIIRKWQHTFKSVRRNGVPRLGDLRTVSMLSQLSPAIVTRIRKMLAWTALYLPCSSTLSEGYKRDFELRS
jgi:hypothetical protein